MSSSNSIEQDQHASSVNSNSDTQSSQSRPKFDEEMKRVAVKKKIERYYYQLIDGCGKENCSNEVCASSPSFKYAGIQANQAAVLSLELLKNKSLLCELQVDKPLKLKKKNEGSSFGLSDLSIETPNGSSVDGSYSKVAPNTPTSSLDTTEMVLTEEKLRLVIEEGVSSQDWSKLSSLVNQAMSNAEVLMESFQSHHHPHTHYTCQSGNVDGSEKQNSTENVEGSSTLKKSFLSMLEDDDEDEDDGGTDVDKAFFSKCNKNNDKASLFFNIIDAHKEDISKRRDTSSHVDYKVTVDTESLKKTYQLIDNLPNKQSFWAPFKNALVSLSADMVKRFKIEKAQEATSLINNPLLPNIYAIIMEMPFLSQLELLETALPNFYTTVKYLPLSCQVTLVRHWAERFGGSAEDSPPSEEMKRIVCCIQHLITFQVVLTPWSLVDKPISECEALCSSVLLLQMFYYAALLGGVMDQAWIEKKKKYLNTHSKAEASSAGDDDVEEEEDEETIEGDRVFRGAYNEGSSSNRLFKGSFKNKYSGCRAPLAHLLDVSAIDCRKPVIELKEFVNEALSNEIEMDKDYANYRLEDDNKFSFLSHPFILAITAKQIGLYFDNRIQMYEERRTSLLQNVFSLGATMQPLSTPYLRLNVRRDHIIEDALINLEMVTMDNPGDLKKQLFVEFDGEQGVDEGGVSKEFFQLVVEEIFNPDFGMFTYDEETRNVWFNEFSFENEAQFTLVGIVIGLAIYNNIILDIKFPMVLYRKLLSRKGNFDDLLLTKPTLARGLQNFLTYEGDVQDLMQTFSIGLSDVFGNVHTRELKKDGANITVTNDNKKEFVDMYADFLLNKSVKKQFEAFKKGFVMVTGESPMSQLFLPHELEMLVCGSDENYDIVALEKSTEYDGGYKADSPYIMDFWRIVHDMTIEQQKKLLQFTTGSDRVPLGGLSKLKLIIAKNGSETDRLPTSHTCFNVLLLPEYDSADKLKERLLKAINYSKGFGMV